jgi:hypothetical protein
MSALGQSRRFRDARDMSGLPQTADISGPGWHFAFVPGPDSTIAAHAQAPKKLPRVSILTTGMETLVAETNSP